MARVTSKIMKILHGCHPNKDFKDNFKDKSRDINSLEKIKSEAEKLLSDTRCNYVGSVEYASLNKMLAICNLKVKQFTQLS